MNERPLAPEWHWESTGTNGGKIVGGCKTAKELGEMVTRLAEHSETEQIHIAKFRRDYDPMIPVEKMQEIINASVQRVAIRQPTQDRIAALHEHLDACSQCRNHPFALCAEGAKRLNKAALG